MKSAIGSMNAAKQCSHVIAPLASVSTTSLLVHRQTRASGRHEVAGEVAGRLLGVVPLQPELDAFVVGDRS